MEVFHDQEQPTIVGRDAQQRDHRFEQAELLLRALDVLRRRVAGIELREELADLPPRRPEARAHRGDVGAGQEVADRLEQRQVRQGKIRFRAASRKHFGPDRSRAVLQFRREPRLPEAGVAGQRDDAALPSVRSKEGVLEDR